MKRELAHRRRWAARAEARGDLIRWIEGWFNPRRLHSSNNYRSPIYWENLYYRRGDGIAASQTRPSNGVNLSHNLTQALGGERGRVVNGIRTSTGSHLRF